MFERFWSKQRELKAGGGLLRRDDGVAFLAALGMNCVPKRGARRRPFELQTLRFRSERVGPERGPPKYCTTVRVNKFGVFRDCLGGGTCVSEPPRRAVQMMKRP